MKKWLKRTNWKKLFLILIIIIFLILGLTGILYIIQLGHGGFLENL